MEENGVLGVIVSGKNGDNGLEIAVSDTGSGIGEKDLMRIFDPYYTTKSSGTGLGLAIVHNIMEAHGGEIRLESEPDSGTTIRLIFPSKT
jgi:two-component system sensor histidine kinase HydH